MCPCAAWSDSWLQQSAALQFHDSDVADQHAEKHKMPQVGGHLPDMLWHRPWCQHSKVLPSEHSTWTILTNKSALLCIAVTDRLFRRSTPRYLSVGQPLEEEPQ